MSWTCPECEALNEDGLVGCACGYRRPEMSMCAPIPKGDTLYPPQNWMRDYFAWAYSALLILASIIDMGLISNGVGYSSLVIWISYFIITLIIANVESHYAKQYGILLPVILIFVIVPAFIWSRLTALRQTRIHFIIWMAAFVFAIYGFGSSSYDQEVRRATTKIIYEQFEQANISEDFQLALQNNGNGSYAGIVTLKKTRMAYPIRVTVIENQVLVQFQ